MEGVVRLLIYILTANLPKNLPVKNFFNRLRFDRIMVMSLWPHFFGPHCICSEVTVNSLGNPCNREKNRKATVGRICRKGVLSME